MLVGVASGIHACRRDLPQSICSWDRHEEFTSAQLTRFVNILLSTRFKRKDILQNRSSVRYEDRPRLVNQHPRAVDRELCRIWCVLRPRRREHAHRSQCTLFVLICTGLHCCSTYPGSARTLVLPWQQTSQTTRIPIHIRTILSRCTATRVLPTSTNRPCETGKSKNTSSTL